jgi:hypothetical protein
MACAGYIFTLDELLLMGNPTDFRGETVAAHMVNYGSHHFFQLMI